jgi:cbb3-type cytochrome oxidase maturation protein
LEILILMVPVTVLVAGGLILLFNWAVDDGQYEDLERAGNEALFDEDYDDTSRPPKTRKQLAVAADERNKVK